MASAEGAASSGVTAATERAGFWVRFGAMFIDGIILGIVAGVAAAAVKGAAGSLIALVVELLYFTLLVGGRGQTVGMAGFGVRVVSKDGGGSIGYGRAAVRWLVSIVSWLVIFIGYLWMLWDSEKQCWHDKAANDVVVRTR